MKTLIDIPDRQVYSLSELCDKFSISRAEAIRRAIELFKDKAISTITWMELMVGSDKNPHVPLEQWLSQIFTTINLDQPISIKAVEIRKSSKIKRPDAIIHATAIVTERLLVTRNTKYFSEFDPTKKVFLPFTANSQSAIKSS